MGTKMQNHERILVAIDTPSLTKARNILDIAGDYIGGIKLGLEFFNHNGVSGVNKVTERMDTKLFLDLKFHDISNTVAGAVRGIISTQPHIINVHTAGGYNMMREAKLQALESAQKCGMTSPLVIGVTVLTALDDTDLKTIGYANNAKEQVVIMAKLAKDAGLDGVVCSAHEIKAIKEACGKEFITVVPGIRPNGANKGDQKRTMTPAQAIAEGADYIVIGRPITEAQDILAAVKEIAESVNSI